MSPPTSIDGTDITGATIDGTDVQEITVDGQTVFTAGPSNLPVAYSNLVAWYPFDSATYGGSNADDVTAILGGSGDDTAYDGTVNGATYQSSGGVTDINAGPNSGVFDFDGSSDFIEATSGPSLGSQLTLCCWVKVDGPGAPSFNVFLGHGEDGGDKYLLWDEDDDQRGTRAKGKGINFTSGDITTGSYLHIAGTFNNDTAQQKYYENGTLLSTASLSGNFSTVSGPIYIGKSDNNLNDVVDARIDDARVYNTELTQSQINQIYQSTKP